MHADEIDTDLGDILQALGNQLRVPEGNNKEEHQNRRHEQADEHDAIECEPPISEVFANELAVRLPREKFWTKRRCVEFTLHGQSCNAQRSLPFSGRAPMRSVRGAMDVFNKDCLRGGLRRTSASAGAGDVVLAPVSPAYEG